MRDGDALSLNIRKQAMAFIISSRVERADQWKRQENRNLLSFCAKVFDHLKASVLHLPNFTIVAFCVLALRLLDALAAGRNFTRSCFRFLIQATQGR